MEEAMFLALFGAVESGAIYAIMALGVYLSFRVLDLPDLTVDGSFVTGAAVAAISIISGVSPGLATILGALAGFLAGCITGILHTKGKINNLLSGILMMIALYSINLRIMQSPQVSLLNVASIKAQTTSVWEETGIDNLLDNFLAMLGLERFAATWGIAIVMLLLIFIIMFVADYFLKTEAGLAL